MILRHDQVLLLVLEEHRYVDHTAFLLVTVLHHNNHFLSFDRIGSCRLLRHLLMMFVAIILVEGGDGVRPRVRRCIIEQPLITCMFISCL